MSDLRKQLRGGGRVYASRVCRAGPAIVPVGADACDRTGYGGMPPERLYVPLEHCLG